MNYSHMRAMQDNRVDRGRLMVTVQSSIRNLPITNAKVTISYSGDPESPIEELTTDANGQTPEIELPAPPLDYSMAPSEYQPYSEYTVQINADGFEPIDVSGTEVLPEAEALLPVRMQPTATGEQFQNIVIPAHTLYGE